MLNLHLVRIFIAVVEQGSFTRAAEALRISQSAVSRGVQELERQLDTALIDRWQRGITLTEAGSILAAHARQIFALERAAETALAELRGLEHGHLAIGASSTIGIYILPPLLGDFHQQYPGIELFLDIGNTQQIVTHLLAHQLDIALVEGPTEGPELVVKPWRADNLVVIASPTHPLVQRETVGITDLAGVPFILREPGSGTREVMETALAEHGVSISVAMELGSTEAVKQAVAAGLGLSIVSTAAIQLELAQRRLAVLPIAGLVIKRPLSCVQLVQRPKSRALNAWLTFAKLPC
ncbi:MAG: LysR family transcriptional regulator [Chloroflexales bacterium]|nr:LysR family transcriptional regulator [Chloroflexales bacterium]